MGTSLFTSLNQKTVLDGKVTIRQLKPKVMILAAERVQLQAFAAVQEMGGVEVYRALTADRGAAKDGLPAAPAAKVDPLSTFDIATVLEGGVVNWSLEQSLSPEALADLNEETQKMLAREILQFSKPELFETVKEAEGAQKND